MPFDLLPVLSWRPSPAEIGVFGVGILLAAGVLGAALSHRLLHLPLLTGYMLTGLLIGPAGVNLLDFGAMADLRFVVDIALGLILFELGRRIDLAWLLRERWLLATSVLSGGAVFAALFCGLRYLGFGIQPAAMAAVLGMTTSPAIALMLVRELRAEGQVTERMLHLTAVGNALAIVLFTIGTSWWHLENQADWMQWLLSPLYRLFGAVLLGWAAAHVMAAVLPYLPDRRGLLAAFVLAVVALLVALGSMLGVSSLIALLFLGVATQSGRARLPLAEADIHPLDTLLCVMLFVYAGAQLTLYYLSEYWWLALAFVALRSLVAVAVTTALARFNGISWRKGACLGLSLFPLSGVVTIVLLSAAGDYPNFGPQLSAMMVSALVFVELFGPLVMRRALALSDELPDGGKPCSISSHPSH